MRKNLIFTTVGLAVLAAGAVTVGTLSPKVAPDSPEQTALPDFQDMRAEVYQQEEKAVASASKGLDLQWMDTRAAVLSANVVSKAEFNRVTEEIAPAQIATRVAPKAVPEMMQAGYVWSAPTLINPAYGGYDAGGSITVTAFDEATGAITINGFPQNGLSLTGKADLAKGTVSFPYQKVGVNSTYGDVAFGDVSTTKPDRKKAVAGIINAQGQIIITQWWGLFVDTEGKDYDSLFGAWAPTVANPANATIQAIRYDASGNIQNKYLYPAIVKQTSANSVTISNYFDGGKDIDAVLNTDKTATIFAQEALSNGVGSWLTIGNLTFEDGKFKSYTQTTTSSVASDMKVLEFPNAGLLTTGYYDGPYKITVNCPEALSYPSVPSTPLKGEGTQANPYKISSLEDLRYLAHQVNTSTLLNGVNYYNKYARVFLGEYFEMTADIDMAGYRFDAIGNDFSHHFAGTFDGKGHTIKNLNSVAYTGQVAGLFGRTDTVSVIKNINFENVTLRNNGTYAAAPVAWSLGTVENINTSNITASAASQGVGGVVGLGKTIRNCHVSNAILEAGMGFVGGVAGETDILIEDCSAVGVRITAGETAGYPYGGVSGTLHMANAARCYANVYINANSKYVGSIIGGVTGSSTLGSIDNCFAVVNLVGYGSESVQGGIVGRIYGTTITDCYSAGRVDGYSSRFSGGIVGWTYDYYGSTLKPITNAVIKNCYTATTMRAETYLYKPDEEYRETLGFVGPTSTSLTAGYAPSEPVVENIYFDNQLTNFGSNHYGVPTATLTAASGVQGFAADKWTFTAGQYPRLKNLADSEAALYSASSMLMAPNNNANKITTEVDLRPMGNTRYGFYVNGNLSDKGHFAEIKDSKIVPNANFDCGTDTLFVVNGTNNWYITLKIAPVPFEGNGTDESPYLINNKADLINLSNITTKSQQLFPGTYFRMTADIDLELDTAWHGICSDAAVAANKFMGVFDGDNHTIHRMKGGTVTIPADGSKPSGTSFGGFIGRLGEDGVLKNISFDADCEIFGFAQIGAAVDYLYGTVENVRNYADVTGISCWIGGIVGQSVGKTSVIRNCFNAGNITSGYFNAGGIIGASYSLIENCMNTGNVSVKSISSFNAPGSDKLTNAGGIAGSTYGCIIRNCVNAGTVYSEYSKAGGIASQWTASSTGAGNNDMTSTLSFGEVYCYDAASIGAIGGLGGSKGENKDVYFDGQLTPFGALGVSEAPGMTGLTTSVLTSGQPIEGLDAQIWDYAAGKYPVLKAFADEPSVVALRSIVVNFGEDATAFDVKNNSTLSSPTGLVWKLASGKKFHITGNTLIPDVPFTESVTDTLVATNGNIVKAILIKGVPPVPFKGNGTEADPYQLASATDWNNLGAYMRANSIDFEGKFFKVMNDFSFGGTEPAFTPIADDGANYLQFTLDGNGKTISGIDYTTKNTFEGMIGVIGLNGVVKNLTVKGKITSTKASTGGLCGKNYGTFENCVNEVEVISTMGTAAGFAVQSLDNAKYINCVNKALIQASGTVAGFTATMDKDSHVTFTKCTNEGTIKATSTNCSNLAGFVITAYPSDWTECVNKGKFEGPTAGSQYIAGLAVNLNGYADARPYNFTDCGNEADIIGKAYIGGLFGLANKTAGYCMANLTRCWNSGDISNASTTTVSSSSGGYAAGLCGFLNAGWNVTDCWNSGTISSLKVIYAGGLFAYYGSTPSEARPTKLTGCYNTGKIIADGNQGGGICAYVPAYTTISKCWNSAEITGTWGIGGIAGGFSGNYSVIEDCYNTGNVTASQNRAGGIYGYGSSTTARCNRCWNTGNVKTTMEPLPTHTATNGGYGIGGITGQTNVPITNCYNAGEISGNISIGGIIGRCTKGSKNASTGVVNPQTTVRNCYNVGKVIAPTDTCGAIVGANTSGTGTYWNEFNEMENCYYASDVLSEDAGKLNNIAIGMPLSQLIDLKISDEFAQPAPNCLPIITGYSDNKAALAFAAAPKTGAGQTLREVKSAITLGTPAGVVWTSDNEKMVIVTETANYTGELPATVTLTATNADFSNSWTIQISADYVTGLDDINVDGLEIDSEIYYTSSGAIVPKPAPGDGQVYMVLVRYTDGSTRVYKLLNK